MRPTLAFWLAAAGFKPTLVERAPESPDGRRGRLLGLGYVIAERMGLKRDFEAAGYHILELRLVCDSGEKLAGFAVATIRSLGGGACRRATSWSTPSPCPASAALSLAATSSTALRFPIILGWPPCGMRLKLGARAGSHLKF